MNFWEDFDSEFFFKKMLYLFSQGCQNYNKAVSSTIFCVLGGMFVLYNINKNQEQEAPWNIKKSASFITCKPHQNHAERHDFPKRLSWAPYNVLIDVCV